MAQTIKIKNGTGSSAPGTLAQGELAINVSSGSIWYGSGSSAATHSNFCFGEITASNRIKNQYGNNTGTGAITASGGITAASFTASGNMEAGAIISALPAGTDNSVVVLNSSNKFVTDEIDSLVWGGGGTLVTTGNFAETLISATEETPYGNSVTATNVTAVATSEAEDFFVCIMDGDSGAQAVETAAHIKYNPGTKSFTVGGSGSFNNIVTVAGISAGGHITGSGNISASGDLHIGSIATLDSRINANQIGANGNVGNTEYGYLNGVTASIQTQLGNNHSMLITRAPIASPSFTGHVTASGEVSSSGKIYSANEEILLVGSFKYASLADGYYGLPGNQGVFANTWGFSKTDGATGLGATSQHIGIRVPYKCVLVGMTGNIRAAVTSQTVKMACWTAELTDNADNTWTKSFETSAITTTANSNRVMGYSDLTGTAVLNAGTSLIPSVLNDMGSTSDIFGNYTIVIRRVL